MGSKGFGGQPEPTEKSRQFILAFKKAMDEDTHQFFCSHLSDLNESLLKDLPLLFCELTKNKKEQYVIAIMFGNFGLSLKQFPLGDRSLNMELGLMALQLVLKVFTRRAFPQDWAKIQNNLGAAYKNYIRGDRADNLEKAIATYELALQIYTREAFSKDWAGTQNNLGIAYIDRIRGDREDNLERAIAAYELALQIYTREAFPKDWAGTQNNLGTAYCKRIRGDRGDNLERAIAAYELALQIYTREAFPEDWAGTQNNLGNAYKDRIRGDRGDNLERAIAAYELALQIYTREAFPKDWAGTQNNLGIAYKDRIRGDRGDNLEKAIFALKLASQIHTREALPEDWAMTQYNLGNVYSDRIQGERADNLEKAIHFFNQAADVFTQKAFPEKWATNQAALAEALMKRAALTNNIQDLVSAIELLQSALIFAVVGSPDFIDTQYRLGKALSRHYEYSHNADDLQQAMQAYEIALEAISPEHYDLKQIWKALPTTQAILGSRLIRDGQWQEGLQLLLNSLTQLKTGDDPLDHANALYQTARGYEVLSDWDNARLFYRDALRLYAHLNDLLGITQSREGLGSVLVSQGYLDKGSVELVQARDNYLQLQKADRAQQVDNIYKAAQRALERQAVEVYA